MSEILTPPEMTFNDLLNELRSSLEFFKSTLQAIFTFQILEGKANKISSVYNYGYEQEFFDSLEATANLISSIATLYGLNTRENGSFQQIELRKKKIFFFHTRDNKFKVFIFATENETETFIGKVFLFQLMEDNLAQLDKSLGQKIKDELGYTLLIMDWLGLSDSFGATVLGSECGEALAKMKSRLTGYLTGKKLLVREIRNRQHLRQNEIVEIILEEVLGKNSVISFGGFSLGEELGTRKILEKPYDEELEQQIFEVMFGDDISLASYLAKQTAVVDEFEIEKGKRVVVSRPSPNTVFYFVVPNQRIATQLEKNIDEIHNSLAFLIPEFFGF
ncbi:MAG: hypothetical protein D6732_08505 [Methanobacteriota archaeon]|nr:MAG: hypothetical protein D6732_08505 [Euryarchaeota archaeon]